MSAPGAALIHHQQNGGSIAPPPSNRNLAPQRTFSREEIDLLKATICKGATDLELKLFTAVCASKRLDPFAKQIYAIKRWDPQAKAEVMTFQVGIDGFRAKADETGLYGGQLPLEWCGPDGNWVEVWLDEHPPLAARARIIRKDWVQPAVYVAHYYEYVQYNKEGKPNAMWSKMPANQLGKCAEAGAFRKGFPDALGGLFAPEEMPESESFSHSDQPKQQQFVPVPGVVQQQMKNAATTPPPAAAPAPPPQHQRSAEDPQVVELWARMNSKDSSLKVFGELKKACQTVLGEAEGMKGYYAALARFGVQHANEFKSTKPARDCAKFIFISLKEIQDDAAREAQAAAGDPTAENKAEQPPIDDSWSNLEPPPQ